MFLYLTLWDRDWYLHSVVHWQLLTVTSLACLVCSNRMISISVIRQYFISAVFWCSPASKLSSPLPSACESRTSIPPCWGPVLWGADRCSLLSLWETLRSLSPLWESLRWGPQSWHIDLTLFSLSLSIRLRGCGDRLAQVVLWLRLEDCFSLHRSLQSVFLTNSTHTHRFAIYRSNTGTKIRDHKGFHTVFDQNKMPNISEQVQMNFSEQFEENIEHQIPNHTIFNIFSVSPFI